jgi:hypothetical protein
MTKSGFLMAAMIAAPMIFAEALVLPVTAHAATGQECMMRVNFCQSGCHPSDRGCLSKCVNDHLYCDPKDSGSVLARPENPKGRPIRPGAAPQGVKPTGGLLDTKPGLPGQGPASTGGAVLNARPSAPPQIR